MSWKDELFGIDADKDEKPLDRLVEGMSNVAIFRTIGFVGDSLSSGEFESENADGTHGFHDYYEYSWGQYIARKNGLTARNFSRGGMTAKEYMESFADGNGFWSPSNACQCYVIALGVNDIFGLNMDIGSVDDVCKEDYRKNKPTLAGYYAMIIARLKAIQPRAKFFLVTMPSEPQDGKDHLRLSHKELLESFAGFFDNTYVIDLFTYSPAYTASFKEQYYLYGHLNVHGYLLTARMIESYMDYIIRKNPKDFAKVPYIGTELE